ncbi:hypothetical protein ACFE04_006802 [Oxalis oulophora]
MESDLLLDHHQTQKPMNSGLTRYSSAPSSYFSSFIDRELNEFLNRPSSPETENIFARFLASDIKTDEIPEIEPNQLIEPVINEEIKPVITHQQHFSNQDSGRVMDYRPPVTSVGIDRVPSMKTGNSSNLMRHNSTPADFLAFINVDSAGFTLARGLGDYGAGTKTSRKESLSSTGKPPISAGRMISPRPEIGMKSSPKSIPMSPWEDSSIFPEEIHESKRLKEESRTLSGLSSSETKILEDVNRPPRLAHHMSLPAKTSADLSAIENFLQSTDSVPCRIRAKRGMATHPRSIAERVRRTKISERMRKLQELVPNMDKQTNTSDMLDLAVDYIKELKRQHEILSDHHAKCTCSSKHQKMEDN